MRYEAHIKFFLPIALLLMLAINCAVRGEPALAELPPRSCDEPFVGAIRCGDSIFPVSLVVYHRDSSGEPVLIENATILSGRFNGTEFEGDLRQVLAEYDRAALQWRTAVSVSDREICEDGVVTVETTYLPNHVLVRAPDCVDLVLEIREGQYYYRKEMSCNRRTEEYDAG